MEEISMSVNDFLKPHFRHKIKTEDGWIAASVPVGADIYKVEEEMRRLAAAIDNFESLSEIDRLRYYLAKAFGSLQKVSEVAKINILDEIDYGNEAWKKHLAIISEVSSIADMACLVIPEQYKTTDIKI